MRILVVEDDRNFLDDLELALANLPGDVEFEVAASRDTALESISRHFFDLIILDLTIPTIDGALDASIEHGNAVFGQCQVIAPGTPIFILTGSTADEIFADLLGRKETGHFWGEEARRGSVDFLQKRRFDEFTTKISPIARAINALNDVEVQKGLKHFQLSLAEDRLIRSFAKGRGGARCVLGLLTGGLSDARVFRAKAFDGTGTTRINAVAKIGSHAAVRAEATRYDKEISRLSPNATPRHLETINFGGKDTAGVFYSLAEGYDKSLFQVAVEEPALVPSAVDCVASLTAPWRDRVPEIRSSIARSRRRALDDAKFRELAARYSLDWVVEFEGRKIQICEITIHGDLHGDNVLVNQSGEATLIDYGDVGKGAASYDPITLEFSHFFRPNGPFRQSGWPNPEQARAWGTDEYLTNCPIPKPFRAFRRWAEDVCAGHREIAASAYAYLVRQLKYPDTNKDRALDLLTGVRRFFSDT